MEFLLLIIVIAYLLARAARRGGRSRRKFRPEPTTVRSTAKPHVAQQSTLPCPVSKRHNTPAPFDQTTATPVTAEESIRGPAYVIDGDSLVIKKTQVRLFGVDAPEMNHPFGKKAKWALVGLCKGQAIKAVITDRDTYGRTVAKCYLPDGRDISAEMVKMGLAIDWPKFSGGIYRRLEVADARQKMWLADARQKGRMHVWDQFEAKQKAKNR